jgi:hypothetical protein
MCEREDNMTNWMTLIVKEMRRTGDRISDIEYTTLSNEDLLKEFDSGSGGTEGKPFTLWTKEYVYFPFSYGGGAEGVASASRYPSSYALKHIGGD